MQTQLDNAVDHSILIQKPEHYGYGVRGIPKKVLNLYLTYRKRFVSSKNCSSAKDIFNRRSSVFGSRTSPFPNTHK